MDWKGKHEFDFQTVILKHPAKIFKILFQLTFLIAYVTNNFKKVVEDEEDNIRNLDEVYKYVEVPNAKSPVDN